MKIERRTGAGWLELDDEGGPETVESCACHGAEDAEPVDQLVGVVVITSQGRRLESAMCADCIARAFALYWGRAHVAAGGDVSDLTEDASGNG